LAREFADFIAALLLTRGPTGDVVSELGRHILVTVRCRSLLARPGLTLA
jgi:hypothetical protein